MVTSHNAVGLSPLYETFYVRNKLVFIPAGLFSHSLMFASKECNTLEARPVFANFRLGWKGLWGQTLKLITDIHKLRA